MEICKTDRVYRFLWYKGVTIDTIHELQKDTEPRGRALVDVFTQTMKITLFYQGNGQFGFVPREYRNGSWNVLYPHETMVQPVTPDMLETQETVERALTQQMMTQFRRSMEGYYDDFPDSKTVLYTLAKDPWVHTLDSNRYLYYLAEIEDDPEWDGGYEVYCDAGKLLIPYKEIEEHGKDFRLLIQHATFVPDKPMSHHTGKFLGKAKDFIGSLFHFHWYDLRTAVDNMWR